jgi:hypothetical protein
MFRTWEHLQTSTKSFEDTRIEEEDEGQREGEELRGD